MKKEMILPIVFAIIFVCAVGLYAMIFLVLNLPVFVKVLIIVFLVLISGIMIYLLFQRNNEIEEEKKNDISKY